MQGCALKDPPVREEIEQQALPGVVVPDAWQGVSGIRRRRRTMARHVQRSAPRAARWRSVRVQPGSQARGGARRGGRGERARRRVAACGPVVDAFGKGGGKLGGDFTGTSGVLVRATWEMDVWGRLRYGRRATEEAYVSAETRPRRGATIARGHAGEGVVRRDREPIAARHRGADGRGCGSRPSQVAQHRQRVGIGNELDVTLAQQTLQTARDSISQLDLAYREAVRGGRSADRSLSRRATRGGPDARRADRSGARGTAERVARTATRRPGGGASDRSGVLAGRGSARGEAADDYR